MVKRLAGGVPGRLIAAGRRGLHRAGPVGIPPHDRCAGKPSRGALRGKAGRAAMLAGHRTSAAFRGAWGDFGIRLGVCVGRLGRAAPW